MIEILVLLVADVTGGGLAQMDLLDVVLQGVLGHELLLAQGALGHLDSEKRRWNINEKVVGYMANIDHRVSN